MNAIQKIARQMSHLLVVAGVSVLALSAGRPAQAMSVYTPEPASFAGCWNTRYGPVVLRQSGSCVSGWYGYCGAKLCGTVYGNTCTGTYNNGCDWGYFQFTKTSNWNYSGCWQSAIYCKSDWWNGECYQPSFQGCWSGGLKLFVDQYGQAFGQYSKNAAGDYQGTIKGQVYGNVLKGTWKNGAYSGTVEFYLSNDGTFLDGRWAYQGGSVWYNWDADFEDFIYA